MSRSHGGWQRLSERQVMGPEEHRRCNDKTKYWIPVFTGMTVYYKLQLLHGEYFFTMKSLKDMKEIEEGRKISDFRSQKSDICYQK